MPFVKLPLLEVVEALIAAHRAAKIDGDDESLALVEAALFHVGSRLKEKADQIEFRPDGKKRGSGNCGDGSLSGG